MFSYLLLPLCWDPALSTACNPQPPYQELFCALRSSVVLHSGLPEPSERQDGVLASGMIPLSRQPQTLLLPPEVSLYRPRCRLR